MKIVNKKKFIVRIIEILVIIGTIILTVLSINYANKIREHQAYGGEYLVPVLGLLIILMIEDWYQESEKKKNENRSSNKRRNKKA